MTYDPTTCCEGRHDPDDLDRHPVLADAAARSKIVKYDSGRWQIVDDAGYFLPLYVRHAMYDHGAGRIVERVISVRFGSRAACRRAWAAYASGRWPDPEDE